MATVSKDFKVKNGLIVEGSTATVNNFDVLTKKTDDQNYIIGLIGGTATNAATANTVVKRDGNASFAAATPLILTFNITATAAEVNVLDGITATTTELNYLSGAASNVQAQLNNKAPLASPALTGTPTAPTASAGTNSNAIATTAYVDGAVSSLVDSAPDLLNTLNELAAAIGDDANFATTLANSVALKQNTLTAGTNIDITGNTISVTGMSTAISSAIDALTTSDIEEGTNQYYTNTRAKTSAAELLTSATLTNITITGSGSGLTITAENGVADSNTDNLVEGSSNLYFSNARAVTALEAVVPDFTAIEINNVAKQIAARATVATASTSTAASWAKADYRSGEFLVKIANGSHTDVSKVILTLDTSDNVAITEYAMVGTNGSLGSVTADVSGNDVRVRVTTANNNSNVMIVGTILK